MHGNSILFDGRLLLTIAITKWLSFQQQLTRSFPCSSRSGLRKTLPSAHPKGSVGAVHSSSSSSVSVTVCERRWWPGYLRRPDVNVNMSVCLNHGYCVVGEQCIYAVGGVSGSCSAFAGATAVVDAETAVVVGGGSLLETGSGDASRACADGDDGTTAFEAAAVVQGSVAGVASVTGASASAVEVSCTPTFRRACVRAARGAACRTSAVICSRIRASASSTGTATSSDFAICSTRCRSVGVMVGS